MSWATPIAFLVLTWSLGAITLSVSDSTVAYSASGYEFSRVVLCVFYSLSSGIFYSLPSSTTTLSGKVIVLGASSSVGSNLPPSRCANMCLCEFHAPRPVMSILPVFTGGY